MMDRTMHKLLYGDVLCTHYIHQGNIQGLQNLARQKGYSLYGPGDLYYSQGDVFDTMQIPF